MKLYVVITEDGYGTVAGVFSSRELAELSAPETRNILENHIVECELDKPIDVWAMYSATISE